MSQNVTQWLAEIQALKQQLADAQQEREQAYTSAANWQRLYETEAQQRRSEVTLARQKIEALSQEIQQLKGTLQADAEAGTIGAERQAELESLSPTELKERLVAVLAERDRLAQALEAEQANHAQTRKSLTTALGDAIDMLSKG